MPYKLFLDKNNLFECDIQLQGASIKNSFARIIVEGKNHSYIFNGEIDQNGHCSVEMNKLKDIFESDETGTIKLEVVADDVYFSPWEDAYQTDLSKKIEVVVKEQEEPVKPMISVSVKQVTSSFKMSEAFFSRSILFLTRSAINAELSFLSSSSSLDFRASLSPSKVSAFD